MQLVLLTALGVGGATVIGAIAGFLIKDISHRFSDLVLAFAAGVMLAAAVLGLILPSLDYGNVLITVAGVFTGAICLNLADRLVPHLHHLAGVDSETHPGNQRLDKVLLFVSAIAIHNLPEGLATGVSFGSENVAEAMLIAGGIALQNIPEGMVIIGPMLAAGISPKRTFLCALATGLIEVLGTLLGYFAVSVASAILPFALAFAGGAMLDVIVSQMLPQINSSRQLRCGTLVVMLGFVLMACINAMC